MTVPIRKPWGFCTTLPFRWNRAPLCCAGRLRGTRTAMRVCLPLLLCFSSDPRSNQDGFLGPAYADLGQFMKSVVEDGGHTTRTAFGPGSSYFSTSSSGYSWQNIPRSLEVDIHRRIKTRWPTNVALGVEGSYVVLYNDGTVACDLRGHYPTVEAIIQNTQEVARRRGIAFLSLNPFFPGEYYAAFGDCSASWNLPATWGPHVAAVSRTLRPDATVASLALAGATTLPPAMTVSQPAPLPNRDAKAAGAQAATPRSAVVGSTAIGGTVQALTSGAPPTANLPSSPGPTTTGPPLTAAVTQIAQSVVRGIAASADSTNPAGNRESNITAVDVLLGAAGIPISAQAVKDLGVKTVSMGVKTAIVGVKTAKSIKNVIKEQIREQQGTKAPPPPYTPPQVQECVTVQQTTSYDNVYQVDLSRRINSVSVD
ncbi:hypothetical protein B0H10DRAFT_2111235 [Mycena sp. CBHHK59/15]|nr:hypothetical protein B0H10DRAFT_2111235 [Mycena sp. CBHHK59/15]